MLWWVGLSLFPLMGKTTSIGMFWGVCEFTTTLGRLSADGWGCVPVLLVVWCYVSSTGACRQLGGIQILVLKWIPPGKHMPINIPWAWEFSGSPASWTQCSHPRGPGPTPGQGTKSPQATQWGQRKKKEKEKKEGKKQTNKTQDK